MSLNLALAEGYRKAGNLDAAEPFYRLICDTSRRQASLEAWQGYTALLHSAARWDDLLPVLGGALGQAGNWESLDGAGKELLADQAAVNALLEVARLRREAGTGRDDVGRWLAAGMLAIRNSQYDLAGTISTWPSPRAKQDGRIAADLGHGIADSRAIHPSGRSLRRGLQQPVTNSAEAALNYYLAGLLAMADRTDEALAAAERAVELQPDSLDSKAASAGFPIMPSASMTRERPTNN